MDKDLLGDIAAGLVLHLDPTRMLGLGAKVTGDPQTWVRDGHFFLCISTDAKRGRWLPLYSNDGPGRIEIAAAGKSGHSKWTSGATYYHPAQVWTVSHQAIVRAAWDGNDKTRAGSRQQLDVGMLPRL